MVSPEPIRKAACKRQGLPGTETSLLLKFESLKIPGEAGLEEERSREL